MKKAIIISIFLTLAYSVTFCQTGKNAISFSFGPSLPISNYGSSSFSNTDAGFAKFGESLNFSFEHKMNNSFSISAMLFGQRHSLNTKAFDTQFSNETFYYGVNIFTPVKFSNWNFKKDKWLSAGLLIGGSNEFPLSKKNHNLSINIKAMIGLVYSASPNLNGSSITDSTLATQTITSKTAIGLSYLFGSGLKYNIVPKYYLLFDINYLATNELKFKNVTQKFTGEIANRSNPILPIVWYNAITTTSTQSITALNVSLGIGLRF